MATITDRQMFGGYDGIRSGGVWDDDSSLSYFKYTADTQLCWVQFDLMEIPNGDEIVSATFSMVPTSTVGDIGECQVDISNYTTQFLASDPYPSGVVAGTSTTFTPSSWVEGNRITIDISTPVQQFVTSYNPSSEFLTLRLKMTENKSTLFFRSGNNVSNLTPTYSVESVTPPRNKSHTFANFEVSNSFNGFKDF